MLYSGGVSEYPIFEESSDLDYYLESVGDTIKKIIQKIKEGCQNIIAKIYDLFTKSKKDDINPNVDIDGKNISKLKKALNFVKKVITWPIKKWIKCFKEGSKFWTILLTSIAVTTAIDIVQSKKKYDVRERNVTRINDIIDKKIEENKKIYNDLENLAKEGKITAKKLSEYTEQYNNVYTQLIEGKQYTRDVLNDKFGTADFNPYPVKALKKVFELLSAILAKITTGMIALQR